MSRSECPGLKPALRATLFHGPEGPCSLRIRALREGDRLAAGYGFSHPLRPLRGAKGWGTRFVGYYGEDEGGDRSGSFALLRMTTSLRIGNYRIRALCEWGGSLLATVFPTLCAHFGARKDGATGFVVGQHKGLRLVLEAFVFCFCAGGAIARPARTSTCRPCRRRGRRLPGLLPWAPGFRRSGLRW